MGDIGVYIAKYSSLGHGWSDGDVHPGFLGLRSPLPEPRRDAVPSPAVPGLTTRTPPCNAGVWVRAVMGSLPNRWALFPPRCRSWLLAKAAVWPCSRCCLIEPTRWSFLPSTTRERARAHPQRDGRVSVSVRTCMFFITFHPSVLRQSLSERRCPRSPWAVAKPRVLLIRADY